MVHVTTNPMVLERTLTGDPVRDLNDMIREIFPDPKMLGPDEVEGGDSSYDIFEWRLPGVLTLRFLRTKKGHALSVKFSNGKFWILSESGDEVFPILQEGDLSDLEFYSKETEPDSDWEDKFLCFSSGTSMYEVDPEKVTCDCKHFKFRCSKYTPDREERLCKHLSSVFVTYPELFSRELRSVDNIETNKDSDGKVRFPRTIFDMYTMEINSVLNQFPNLIERYEVCGSYRRLEDRISDLDYLIIIKDGESWDSFLDYLENTMGYSLVPNIGRGSKKAAYLIDNYVRVDFKAVTEENWPYALLHFTGPKSTNIEMRRKANAKGFRLNEYGLFRDHSDIPVTGLKSEKEIYDYLEIPYKEPWDR